MIHTASLIAGEVVVGGGRVSHEIRSPYSGKVIGKIDMATAEDLDRAIETAYRVFHGTIKKMPAYRRAEILHKTANLLE